VICIIALPHHHFLGHLQLEYVQSTFGQAGSAKAEAVLRLWVTQANSSPPCLLIDTCPCGECEGPRCIRTLRGFARATKSIAPKRE